MDISPTDYKTFCQILERQSGILLGENKQYLVASRLSSVVKENDLGSLSNLLTEIGRPSGKALQQRVIDQMTTNETLWYRDSYPFEFIKRHLVPEFKRQGGAKIWCAACSSGQEPYSLAMLLDEGYCLSNIKIIATDLSARILERAKTASYQDIELRRGLPHDKLKRYFSKVDENTWQINQTLRDSIHYSSMNLLNLPYSQGKFDVIFCRNVLIYFSQSNKTLVLNGLIESLKPGGYLIVGASESLTRECYPLEMVRCNPGLVYRKK